MIVGMAIDLCSIQRFHSLLTQENLLSRIFHTTELAALHTLDTLAASHFLAGRWAAKESLVKACALSIFSLPLDQAYVVKQPSGAVQWQFLGAWHTLMAERKIDHTWLSLSYENDMAVAITLLEHL
jgi:holo-[acyl-carrier protein] synthase